MAEEDMTQRERRAQRHRKTRGSSSGSGRSARRYIPMVLIALLVVSVAVGVFMVSNQTKRDCVTSHWHATFALFKEGPEGEPVRIDFSSQKTANGNIYYDFDSTRLYGGARAFDLTAHMHQDPNSPETGDGSVARYQLHMEDAGKCTGVRAILRKVDVDAQADKWILTGPHAQVGQAGTIQATPESPQRWWLQTHDACGVWTWHEKTFDEIRGYQLKDGESIIGAIGSFNETQVKSMQDSVPPPSSRVPNERCPAPTTSAAAPSYETEP